MRQPQDEKCRLKLFPIFSFSYFVIHNIRLGRATDSPPFFKHKNTKKMRKIEYNYTEMNVDNEIYEGQSIEREMEQAETAKMPISQSAPIIYTERKDGVRPEYDIRTDRFEIAQEAMGKVAASIQAKRMENIAHNGTEDTKATATGQTTTTQNENPSI